MTLRTFLIGAILGLAISWGVWLLVILWLDPAAAPIVGHLLFFLSLFLAIANTSALLGYGLRRVVSPQMLPAYRVRSSFRQGIWLGLFFDVLLFLQLQRLLHWWVTTIIIVMFLSLEFVFLSYDRGAGRNQATEGSGDDQA